MSMYDKMVRRLFFGMLAACLMPLAHEARAAAQQGNCASMSIPISVPCTLPVTLQREWSELLGDWWDAGVTDVTRQNGTCYLVANFTPGKPYVIWISNAASKMITVYQTYLPLIMEGGVPSTATIPNTWFGEFWAGDDLYLYVDSGIRGAQSEHGWSPVDMDAGSAQLYFAVSGGYPGQTCTFNCAQKPLADVIPQDGTESVPHEISVATAGTAECPFASGTKEYWFSANLEAGKTYAFTTPSPASGVAAVMRAVFADDDPERTVDESQGEDGSKTIAVTLQREGAVKLCVTVAGEWGSASSADLSWTIVDGGSVAFQTGDYRVSGEDSSVSLTVRRTAVGKPIDVLWGTVSESALAGQDYLPQHGVLHWEAEDDSDRTVTIPLLSAPVSADETRSFSVRLVAAPESEWAPAIPVDLARVTIERHAVQPVPPEIPPADDEPYDRPLAVGSFDGVLLVGAGMEADTGSNAYARVSVESAADGTMTAHVRLSGGADWEFAGEAGCLTSAACPGAVLTVFLPEGTVADLSDAPGGVMEASLSLAGSLYSGDLFRVQSQMNAPVLDRMVTLAGTYLYALRGAGDRWVPQGCGVLSAKVAVDGTTEVSGCLADGKPFAIQAKAYETSAGLAVPLYWQDADGLTFFGGTLRTTGESALAWHDDRAQYGGDGASGFAIRLTPQGGRHDETVSVGTRFRGYELVVDDLESPFADWTLVAEGDAFVSDDLSVSFDFDAAEGVLTGSDGQNSFVAALLPGTDGFLGYELSAGKSRPFALQAFWMDPDYSESWGWTSTVTFNLNGAQGQCPASVEVPAGGSILLPIDSPDTFFWEGQELRGWRRSDTGALVSPGSTMPAPAKDVTLTAEWTFAVRGIAEALDCDLTFANKGTAVACGWRVDPDASSEPGGSSVRSGDLVRYQESVLETTVQGAGRLQFDYKTSSHDDNILTVTVEDADGTKATILEASGKDSAWQHVSYEITTEGAHTIRFRFYQSARDGLSSGNCAWIDRLQFGETAEIVLSLGIGEAEGATVALTQMSLLVGKPIGLLPDPECATLRFVGWQDARGRMVSSGRVLPRGGLELTAAWEELTWQVVFASGFSATGKVPDPIPFKLGETVRLPGRGDLEPLKSGATFLGWTADGVNTLNEGADYVPTARRDVTFTSVWDMQLQEIALAMECSLPFEFGGSVEWTVEERAGYSCVGDTCAWSGTLARYQTAAMTTHVIGPGTLSFKYKMSCRSGDELAVLVDDENLRSYDGGSASGGWRDSGSLAIPAGEHKISFVFSKNARLSGDNCVWMDSLVWEPEGQRVTVRYDDQVKQVLRGTEQVENGETLLVSGGSVALTVTAVDWRAPSCDSAVVTTEAARDVQTKTYVITPTEDCTVEFSGVAYAGDADGRTIISGKTVDAAKACAWGVAHGVTEADFGAYYDDYLLNVAPGTDAGIRVSDLDFSVVGEVKLAVAGTGVVLDNLNGMLVLQATSSLGEGFVDVDMSKVAVKATADSAVLTVPAATDGSCFFRVLVK